MSFGFGNASRTGQLKSSSLAHYEHTAQVFKDAGKKVKEKKFFVFLFF